MDDNQVLSQLQSLRAEIDALKKEVTARDDLIRELHDIESIKRLQCAYSYYMEHAMVDEVIDCFSSDPNAYATTADGTFAGPESVRRHFEMQRNMPPSYLHMVLPVAPVITVEAGGTRARGRWYGYGNILMRETTPLDPINIALIYEMEYIKEDNVWKILGLSQNVTLLYQQGPGPEDESKAGPGPIPARFAPDTVPEFDTEYPSGYIMPMHFKHPVTGRPTTEKERNAGLKLGPNKRSPWKKR